MRPARPQNWVIAEGEDGTWDLTHGNRPVVLRMQSYLLAIRQLQIRHRAGERVYQAETDGYRTEITKQLIRSGTIGTAGAMPLRRRLHWRR